MSNSFRPLLYIAAPYTNPDPVENTHRVIRVADVIYNGTVWVPVVPHLSLLWHLVVPHRTEFWYSYDLHLLAACDAWLRLPGMSEGADKEEIEAKRLRLDEVLFADMPHAAQEAWG